MDNFRFIHMSDIHFLIKYLDEGFEGYMAGQQNPQYNVCECLKAEKNSALDFVLITGDLSHEGNDSDYRELKRILIAELGDIPIIALPGNHDPRESYCRGFLNVEPMQSLDSMQEINGFRIITLDTGNGINGLITPAQLDWLNSILSEPSKNGTLLALHHPLIPNQDGLKCAEYEPRLYEIIEKSDIAGIFCGHTHHNYISQFAAKPYFTAGSMAFSMVIDDETILYENHAEYNLISLCNGIPSVQVKPVAPACDCVARFSLNKLSELLTKRK